MVAGVWRSKLSRFRSLKGSGQGVGFLWDSGKIRRTPDERAAVRLFLKEDKTYISLLSYAGGLIFSSSHYDGGPILSAAPNQ